MSGLHCHVRASSTSDGACVYFTVQCCIEYSSTVSSFQAQDVQKQVWKQWWCEKSSGPEKRQRKTRGRSNWRNKQIYDIGNGEGIFLIWADTVVFLRHWTKCRMVRFWIAAAIHNAIQCYLAINDETKELLPRNKWLIFSRR